MGAGALASLTVVYLAGTLFAPLPVVNATMAAVSGPPEDRAAASPQWPSYGHGAVGAVDFDGNLAIHGDKRPVPIASITKVVTTLVVLDEKPLRVGDNGPDILFTDADFDIYNHDLTQDASVAHVEVGSVLTERQVIEATLLPSASNYAQSLAKWAFGSVDKYLEIAKTWLELHGLAQTTVVDTSGLSPLNVSTTTNLVELGKLALGHPVVSDIVATPQVTIPGAGVITNSNTLLGVNGVDGIKTGTTDEAGYCLLFAKPLVTGSKRVTIVGVLLGGPNRSQLNEDIDSLLSSVAKDFHEVTVVTENQRFGTYSTAWGQNADLVSGRTVTAVVWADTPVSISAQARPVSIESASAEVGTVNVTIGPTTLAVPLRLAETTSDPGAWWRITHPVSLVG